MCRCYTSGFEVAKAGIDGSWTTRIARNGLELGTEDGAWTMDLAEMGQRELERDIEISLCSHRTWTLQRACTRATAVLHICVCVDAITHRGIHLQSSTPLPDIPTKPTCLTAFLEKMVCCFVFELADDLAEGKWRALGSACWLLRCLMIRKIVKCNGWFFKNQRRYQRH